MEKIPGLVIPEIYNKQVEFFKTGITIPIKYRIDSLKKLYRIITKHENEIYSALKADLNKSQFESYATEIGYTLEEISTHIKHLANWASPKRTPTPITNFPASSYITREPLGTVLIIAPWNYPFQLLLTPLIGAISAGNTAILKPSEISQNTSRLLRQLINDNFSPEFIKVIEGGKEVTQNLLKQRFDYIFFTGSPRVGQIVMKAAAENLTPVTLELGGKSPCIVDSNIKLRLAARRIVWGKLINAGQTCIAPDYIMVEKSVKDKLIRELIIAIEKFYGKDFRNNAEYPRIITKANVSRLASLIDGKKIVYGGGYDLENRYFSPTILDDITPDDAVMQQEIFGPIFPVLSYDKIDEVIDYINSKPKPLALYFFSECKRKQKHVLKDISAGGVTINDTIMHFVSNRLPFGGVGNSGHGRYHGEFSFQTFSNTKSVVYKKTWLDIPIRYAPFKKKLKLIKFLMR